MGRHQAPEVGKRISIWLPPKQLKVANQIDNLSNFVQMALDVAPDIMAWAMLKEYDPKKFDTGKKLDDVVDDFNKKYPQNALTQGRKGKWQKNYQNLPELW